MDQHFAGASAAQSSYIFTLHHVKNRFGLRSVKKRVMENVPHVYQLLDLTCDGLICLTTMNMLTVADINNVPPTDNIEDVMGLARDIVDFLWPSLDKESFEAFHGLEGVSKADEQVVQEDEKVYCVCHVTAQAMDENQSFVVECSAQENCLSGHWFHLTRKGLREDDVPDGDWWCSSQCREFSVYCTCKKNITRPKWIGCSSGEFCLTSPDGWFHTQCTGHRTIPKGDWFCGDACKAASHNKRLRPRGKEQLDHVQEYTRSVAWQALHHKCRLNAERENDGQLMNALWKLDMVFLWNGGHNKYLILGHRLTAALLGCVHPRVAMDMTHNRTANVSGEPGRNVALDLKCEHSNKDFQGALRASHGHFSDKHALRISQMVGAAGKEMDKLYLSRLAGTYTSSGHEHKDVSNAEVHKFIEGAC